ncbi:MAG: zinc ribbon domain-containing protein [Planctomycetes bacterium]|nr:zinc ribbon domain-containing protein [Planctomycetota bacterium]
MSGAMNYIIFLAAAVLMVFTSQQSEQKRLADRQKDVGEMYVKRDKMLTGGFDAVLADFTWMKTNLRRRPDQPKNLSEEEKKEFRRKVAQRDYVGYKKVLELDPTFKKAYDLAISRLMDDLPDEAIGLAKMGRQYCSDDAKEFSEIAGYIAAKVKKDNSEALGFYRDSVEGGPRKDFIGRMYLRTKLRLASIDPYAKDLKTQKKIIEEYHKVYKEFLVGPDDMEGMEGMEGAPSDEYNYDGESWVLPELEKHLKNFLLKCTLEKHDLTEKDIESVRQIYRSLKKSEFVCGQCYSEYEAGDDFCSSCGHGLKKFGACKKCSVVLKGKFCHSCGTEAPKETVRSRSSQAL